ncbi:two component transcriptional regulator, LuxR family [Pseudomonas gessardii]|uniref:Response regulator n=1 Tax=Pseudomonas gessardii TaxID=78544 RepID=A0A7Y1QQA1_9PSED|nr:MULTISPECIES: response regulator [Pseudomonas]MCF4980068.1 response regulator [Pseudomonas gessardii]MCF4993086.1 response regulator [Pseudomonas gessardii]MCF5085187.1 response regulator [Pseudomonas gessardii]MCF5095046.1 response regulator [Pseudomonas gessardii]MCF5109281.1 response regulator [Pseudomonas gessardii]
METLNVVIADDHPIVLVGVRELIERDARFRVVGEALCSNTLVSLLESTAVDLVITDFNMPADSPYGDGLKLVEYLTRHFPTVRVLVLTMISNPLILTRLQELGVLAVIQKNQMYEEIQTVLKAIGRGNPVRHTGPQSTSVMDSGADLDQRFTRLSPKEHEILRLFVAGQSVNEIARGLNRSAKTISTQKISAMRKLEVSSDQSLLAYCIERKLFN